MKPLSVLLFSALTLAMAACARSDNGPAATSEEIEEGRIDFSRTTGFDGNVLTVDVSSRDGGTLKLNTLRDDIATEEFRPPVPNHSGRSRVLRNTAYDSTSLVYAVVSWDNDDPTDYLAAGWWVHVPTVNPGPETITRAIFIDGPEIDPADPPDMPVTGQARYVGDGGGVVQYEFGSSWGDLAGEYALGEYEGVMSVVANFDEGTVSGCLGCIGDIEPQRRHIESVYEDVLGVDLPDVPAPVKDYEIHFAPVAYNADSTFQSEVGNVTHPTRIIIESSMHWGGSFSNVDDAKGNPRLVGGFTDASFTEADGSEGLLWGIFTALTPEASTRGR